MFLDNALNRRVTRKQIDAVIETDPRPISLVRSDFLPDGAGGLIRSNPVPLAPQWGKLIESTLQLPTRITEDGRTVRPTKVLVMGYKADVKMGDTFEDRNAIHEVVYVDPTKTVKTSCEVIVNG